MLTLSIVQERENVIDGTHDYRFNVRINYKVIVSKKIKSLHSEKEWKALVQQILDEEKDK